MSKNSKFDKRRVLVPLATLLAASAVAIGSGASFTSTSAHSASVTSGVLHHTNNHDGATLSVTNFRPGDVATGSVTVTNDGTIDSTLTLAETSSTNTFTTDDLKLKITQGSTVLFDGNFGDLSSTPISLGDLNVGESTTVDYMVSFSAAAGNEDQGKTASATYQWVSTQKSTPSSVVNWVAGLI